MTALAPIVLFTYRRPEIAYKTLTALSKNPLAGQSILYIYADGPKENASEEILPDIKRNRQVIRKKKWCKEVIIIERKENKGLANSVIEGVTEVVNRHGKAIIMEDDLITSKGFLKYINDALTLYENNDSVISISAYMYPVKKKLPDTFFLRMADCLGWATWKRGWQVFETDAKKLLQELIIRNLSCEFDFMGNYPYTKMLEDQVKGKNYSWAILWYASAFLKNKLTLYPNLSLVNHIGINGTNYNSDPFLDKVNLTDEIKVLPVEVLENKVARQSLVDFFAERKRYLCSTDY